MKRWLETINDEDSRKLRKIVLIAAIVLIVSLMPGIIIQLWGVLISTALLAIPTIVLGLPLAIVIFILWKLL